MNTLIESLFPGMDFAGWRITSAETPEYNCIAWAAADSEKWWWPDPFGDYYWPEGVPREETVEAFTSAFRLVGFETCEQMEFDSSVERVALYTDTSGTPTHMARELPSGSWTSKLGQLEDIEHDDLEALQGDLYGVVRLVMCRPAAAR